MSRPDYALGHSSDELRRLKLQADMIHPVTRRLLLDAGLVPGMRVLDVGCGNGEVTRLAASIVGPDGHVLGVDREATVVEAAQRFYAAMDLPVSFRQHDFAGDAELGQFDLAIGRYVLMYQPSPDKFIQQVARFVRPSGVIAFHEICVTDDLVRLSKAPLFRSVYAVLCSALASATAHPDLAGRLGEVFALAGFPSATVGGELMVYNDPQAPYYEWLYLMMCVLLPHAERLGLTTAGQVDVDTLEQRLRDEAASLRSQAIFPAQCTAWARKAA